MLRRVGERPRSRHVVREVVTGRRNGNNLSVLSDGGGRSHDRIIDHVVNASHRRNRDHIGRTIEGRSLNSNVRTKLTTNDNSRLRLRQAARDTRLKQELVLVEVDVEVLEEREFSTLIRTDGVVNQVDND